MSFFKKVERYAKVTSSATGLAGRVLGEKYLGINIDDAAYAQKLTQILGNMKGPLMKAAQFLSTIPDAIPHEYADQLMSLQSQAPSMGRSFVRRRMKMELGPDWENHFSDFNHEACNAASLGQVHKATLTSGENVACKLQYPDMETLLEADLNQLKLFLNLYESTGKALKTDEIYSEIKEKLLEELDYKQEAEHIKAYQDIFKNDGSINVPGVFEELSTKRLLTLSLENGVSLKEIPEEGQEYRNLVGRNLFYAWYKPLCQHHMIHGDPHPGNYLFQENGDITLLDFGCVRQFEPTFSEGLKSLFQGLLHKDQGKVKDGYHLLGFKDMDDDLIDIMNQWASLLFEPLLDDRVRPIEETYSGSRGWNIAKDVHQKLREAGGMTPPREFVFMDRSAVGIGSVLMRLKSEQNWHQLFCSLLGV